MPWNNQSGNNNPWGDGPNGNGPRHTPQDIEDLIKKSQDRFKQALPSGPKIFFLGGFILLALWMLTGFYRVDANEQAVVLQFGTLKKVVGPGLHYHFPTPIEKIYKEEVEKENKIQFGTTRVRVGSRLRPTYQEQNDSLMLTRDENIAKIPFTLIWKIKDLPNYLFNVRDPEATIRAVSESSIREVIAKTPIRDLIATEDANQDLSKGRLLVEQETQQLIQETLDRFKTGITVRRVQLAQGVDAPDEVVDAFRDVQRARADKERKINEAQAYYNSVIPVAQGKGARILQEAKAYKEKIISESEGDAKRFLSIYQAYNKAPDIYTKRLYLETVEGILKNRTKVIIDDSKGAEGVVPYLPLPELRKKAAGQ